MCVFRIFLGRSETIFDFNHKGIDSFVEWAQGKRDSGKPEQLESEAREQKQSWKSQDWYAAQVEFQNNISEEIRV